METWSAAELDWADRGVIVDAYGEGGQRLGFFSMMEQDLALPFTVEMLGVAAEVTETSHGGR